MSTTPGDLVVPTPSRGVRIVVHAAAAVGFALLFLLIGTFLSDDRAAAEEPALLESVVDTVLPDVVAEPLAPVTDAVLDPVVAPVLEPVVAPVAPIVSPVLLAVGGALNGAVNTAIALPVVSAVVPISPVQPPTELPLAGQPAIDPVTVIEPAEIPAGHADATSADATNADAIDVAASPSATPQTPAHPRSPLSAPGNTPATAGGSAAATGAADIQSRYLSAPAISGHSAPDASTEPAPFPSFEHDSSPD